MNISVKELNLIYEYITKQLLVSHIDKLELTSDYYWFVSSDVREDVNKEPKLCVGSLEDDWDELKKIFALKKITPVDLDRFANILIAVGEKISKSKDLVV